MDTPHSLPDPSRYPFAGVFPADAFPQVYDELREVAHRHLAREAEGHERADLLVALDDAVERLASFDARQAQVVELRFFGGLTEDETAATLGIGLRTAKRDWAKARSWLYQTLYPDTVG